LTIDKAKILQQVVDGKKTVKKKKKSKKKKPQPLNIQQRKFIAEYVKLAASGKPNGKQAAINAGYSEKTAETQASRLLSYEKVSAEIDKAIVKVEKQLMIESEDLAREMYNHVYFDISDIMEITAKGDLLFKGKSLKDIPEDLRRCIQQIEPLKDLGYKIKFVDRQAALKMLANWRNMFIRKKEVSVNMNVRSIQELVMRVAKESPVSKEVLVRME